MGLKSITAPCVSAQESIKVRLRRLEVQAFILNLLAEG